MRRSTLLCASLLVALSLPALANEPVQNPVHAVTAQLTGEPQHASAFTVAPLPPPGEIQLGDLLPVIANAFATGNWLLFALGLALGAVLVFFSVNGVRAFLGRYWPWFLSDRAGVVLAASIGPLGAMIVAVAAGQPLTASMVVGLIAALLASGAKSWQRKVVAQPASSGQPTAACTPEQIANGTCKP
jgi:lysylphosphatidylglycerol synthetase-like protein (DUF2156 family)